jgi:hypothetical protein
LMLSAAKLDAFIHAAQCGCEPGIPMVCTEAADVVKPPGVLAVSCPAGCGATLYVPVTIADTPSIGSGADELDARFVAEAPQLHDCITAHLRACSADKSSPVDAPLPNAATWSAPPR